MKRDLKNMSEKSFDVAIIGGGIYGSCLAWDAALRGLSTVIVEKGDFGHATSSNSHRIIHGGFRYLQSLDFKRLRESVRERNFFMRCAPHLVRSIPFLIPAKKHGLQTKAVLGSALKMYDLLAGDRNEGIWDPTRRLPSGRLISKEELFRLAPQNPREGVTGAGIWYDGLFENSERIVLSIIKSAVQAGAEAANYASAIGLLRHSDGGICGVKVKDVFTGGEFDIRAKLVINAAGPWVNRVAGLTGVIGKKTTFSKCIALVTRPLTRDGYGLSFWMPHFNDQFHQIGACCYRLHVTPWKNHSIVGSVYLPVGSEDGQATVSEGEIRDLMTMVNMAYPGFALVREDVRLVHMGLLPRRDEETSKNARKLAHHYSIIDHESRDKLAGLISVVGVKYTTARDVAEKTVDLAFKKLLRPFVKSVSRRTPVMGGDLMSIEGLLKEASKKYGDTVDRTTLENLVVNYGTGYGSVLDYGKEDRRYLRKIDQNLPVIAGEVIHGIRHEMALTLEDIVMRRTELGCLGYPGNSVLSVCADFLRDELGWDFSRTESEIRKTKEMYRRHGVNFAAEQAVTA